MQIVKLYNLKIKQKTGKKTQAKHVNMLKSVNNDGSER